MPVRCNVMRCNVIACNGILRRREAIIRRVNGKREQEERLLIYYCNECGVLEYEYEVIIGGKLCPGGCGYLLENEEAE